MCVCVVSMYVRVCVYACVRVRKCVGGCVYVCTYVGVQVCVVCALVIICVKKGVLVCR